jgi:hypothetical protein
MTDSSKTTPYLRRANGRRDALDLFTQGLGVMDIASELDTQPAIVSRWLSTAVSRIPGFSGDDLRALQEVRLDRLSRDLMPLVADKTLAPMTRVQAAKAVLEVERHRSALFGLGLRPDESATQYATGTRSLKSA